ncbi:MAG: hypothetical protein KGN36_14005 [Acidobacteriota bacterium]|nr:hypothetical protein [Acidobacteriota bacterium]
MDELRRRLKLLRDGLLTLHKTLLDSEKAAYERDIARITSTGQYLDLVMNDPFFQPLRELSQFIVVIDEALARKEPPLTTEEDRELTREARRLLVPNETGSGFARRYFEILQRDPATVLAHRDMLQVVNGL